MAQEPKFAEEIKKRECEPLLPVEKKLIGGSLLLGLILLGILTNLMWLLFIPLSVHRVSAVQWAALELHGYG